MCWGSPKRRVPKRGAGKHLSGSPAVRKHGCPVGESAPAFAFEITVGWWFKETHMRTWPCGKIRPSRASRGFDSFRFYSHKRG